MNEEHSSQIQHPKKFSRRAFLKTSIITPLALIIRRDSTPPPIKPAPPSKPTHPIGLPPPSIEDFNSPPFFLDDAEVFPPSSESFGRLPEEVLLATVKDDGVILFENADSLGKKIKLLPLKTPVEIDPRIPPQNYKGCIWVKIITDSLSTGFIAQRSIEVIPVKPWPIPEDEKKIATPLQTDGIVITKSDHTELYSVLKRDLENMQISNPILKENTLRAIQSIDDLPHAKTELELESWIKGGLMDNGIGSMLIYRILSQYLWIYVDRRNNNPYSGWTNDQNKYVLLWKKSPLLNLHEFSHNFFYAHQLYELIQEGIPKTAVSLAWWCKTLSQANPQEWPEYAELITYIQKDMLPSKQLCLPYDKATTCGQAVEKILALSKIKKDEKWTNDDSVTALEMSEHFAYIARWCAGHPFGPQRMPRAMWNSCFAGFFNGKPLYSRKSDF